MGEDRFGEIRIERDASEKASLDLPLPHGDERKTAAEPAGSGPVPLKAERPVYRRKRKRSTAMVRFRAPSRRTVLLLSILPFLALLYGVGGYIGVPLLVDKAVLASLGNRFERPVAADRIVFSPFTLSLMIHGLEVGPRSGDRSGRLLLRLEDARLWFSLSDTLQGKLLCRKTEIDSFALNVQVEGGMTGWLTGLMQSLSAHGGEREGIMPSWVWFDEIRVTNGSVQLDDRETGKRFTVEQISLNVPSAKAREEDPAALPRLTAVVDSSPFEVNAVRFRALSGSWRTGFNFSFKSLLLANFSSSLPLPDMGLQLLEGEADLTMNVILPDNEDDGEGIVLEGESRLRGLAWEDEAAGARITLPGGRTVFRYIPAEHRTLFKSVELQEPQVRLVRRVSGTAAFLAGLDYLRMLLGRPGGGREGLAVENLIVVNGAMEVGPEKGPGFRLIDSSLSLNGFERFPDGSDTVHKDAQPTRFRFHARDGAGNKKGTVSVEGELDDETIKAAFKVSGLDLKRYSDLLPPGNAAFTRGTADLSFQYQGVLENGRSDNGKLSGGRVYNGSLRVSNALLTRNGKKALTAQTLNCSEFHADPQARVLVCDKGEVVGGTVQAEAFFASEEDAKNKVSWKFLLDRLTIEETTVRFPVQRAKGKKEALVLENVRFQGSSLQATSPGNNFKGVATVAGKGAVSVHGGYSVPTGKGLLQLDIREVELSALAPWIGPWLLPQVKTGIINAAGSLRLPERELRGMVQVNGFSAVSQNGPSVGWQEAFTDNCLFRLQPLRLEVDRLTMRRPVVKPGLSSGDSPLFRFVRLTGKRLPPEVRIREVLLEEGSYEFSEPILYPGYQPQVDNVAGTVRDSGEGQFIFDFNGTLEGSRFSVSGESTLEGPKNWNVAVEGFSLAPFAVILKRETGVTGNGITASWKQKAEFLETEINVATRLHLSDVEFDPSALNTPVLPLLIDVDRNMELEIEGSWPAGTSHSFLLQSFINRIRHLEVKASISPDLVLEEVMPGKTFAGQVVFAPGSAVAEDPSLLDSYAGLLSARPFLRMQLTGTYGATDREALHAALQAEADRKRDEENRRRALEKVRLLQLEKRRAREAKQQQPGVVVEEIIPEELTRDLEPLPRTIVEVPLEQLRELARERAESLRQYCVDELGMDPERVAVTPDVTQGEPAVRISLHPYQPPGTE